MQIQYIKQFSVEIDGTQYPVIHMDLQFGQNQIQTCNLVLACGTALTSIHQTANITNLYKQLLQQTTVDYPQVVISYRNGGVFFRGIVINMAPAIQGGQASAQQIRCSCLGLAGCLLYNPLTDFVFSPPSSNSPQNMQNAGAGNKPGYKSLWSTAQANFDKCIAPTVNSKMKVDQIFQTFQDKLTQIKAKVLVADKEKMKVMPAVSDYIKCNYRPATITNVAQFGLYTYASNLFNAFKQGIVNGQTIFNCVQAGLAQNTLLTMTPAGDGSCMWIVPSYQYGLQGIAMSFDMSDILSLQTFVNAAARAKQPGTLRVNFAYTSQWQNPQAKSSEQQILTGNIGSYTQKNTYTYKQIVGPWWVVQAIIDQRNKNAQDAKNNKTEQKAINYQGIYDAYAKYAYAQLYGKSCSGMLSLAPSQKNLDIRNYIGRTIYIDLSNMGISGASSYLWKSVQGFFGVVNNVTIDVRPVADRGKNSSFTITCGFQRLTAKHSPFAPLFTQKLNSRIKQLYQKV